MSPVCRACTLGKREIYFALELIEVVVVQSLSRVRLFVTHGLRHASLLCPSPFPGACSNSCPSSQWCHPTISSSVVPFFSRLQSFSASGSFLLSQLFASGGCCLCDLGQVASLLHTSVSSVKEWCQKCPSPRVVVRFEKSVLTMTGTWSGLSI